jgi:hypothetical protein
VVAPPRTGGDGWEEWRGGGWGPGEEELRELSDEDAADLDDTYWDSVERGPFEEEVRSGWYTRGQHDAGALALIDVLDRAVGLRPARPLAGQLLIGRSAGWWWPFEQVAILTERPCALDLARDEQGRLHHPSGPVVAYPDGWAVWAWHGVRVPRQVVERPDTITVAQIRGARNLEVRRVLLERYGLDRYLRDADATLVAADEYGKLWRCELPGDEPLAMVEVVSATPTRTAAARPTCCASRRPSPAPGRRWRGPSGCSRRSTTRPCRPDPGLVSPRSGRPGGRRPGRPGGPP